ncbi:hypothetical protein WI73_30130 [Burkholderia ubonensis]|nr:hypothetical protein [Burkholderia ubonensis]AOI69119.1 hypothetical protein WI31_05735 [Burkholderia ubonensis]KUZ19547.1 hypothetical protein WI29_02785 [Burkholderia ubonensis]KUZ30341.1 hypothetical protein WI32_24600 [Burkholderia ubonensis]KUZ38459.1 hypothetical protein WI30_03015 [Burkholderia ubonensis]KUZ42930.1 hypothetical protein WI33_33360 [Burkholderia ubonensis]
MDFTDAVRSAFDQYPGFEGRAHRAHGPLIAFISHVGPTVPLTGRRAHRTDHPGRFGPAPLVAG